MCGAVGGPLRVVSGEVRPFRGGPRIPRGSLKHSPYMFRGGPPFKRRHNGWFYVRHPLRFHQPFPSFYIRWSLLFHQALFFISESPFHIRSHSTEILPPSYTSGTWAMSDSQLKLWSDNPNAPKISYDQYFEEKVYFAGVLLGSILYGTREARSPTRLSADPHFVSPVSSRDRHRVVLPMHLRAV